MRRPAGTDGGRTKGNRRAITARRLEFGEWSGLNRERLLTRFPISSAQTAGLDRFEYTKGFVDAAADVEAADNLILKYAVRIDDEETAQGVTLIFHQNAEIAADIFGDVGSQHVLDRSEPTFIFGGVDPGAVAEYA